MVDGFSKPLVAAVAKQESCSQSHAGNKFGMAKEFHVADEAWVVLRKKRPLVESDLLHEVDTFGALAQRL